MKSPNSAKGGGDLAQLEAAAANAAAKLTDARIRLGRAARTSREGEPTQALQLARAAFDEAQLHEVELQAAIVDARADQAKLERSHHSNEKALAWKRVEAIARRRLELAHEVENLTIGLCAKLAELLPLGPEMFKTAPGRMQAYLSNSLLSEARLSVSFRRYLRKHGVEWAFRCSPHEAFSLPNFAHEVAEGNALILSRKDLQTREGVNVGADPAADIFS